MRIQGTEFNYDLDKREANKARLRQDSQIATGERAKAYLDESSRNNPSMLQGNYASLSQRYQLIPPQITPSVIDANNIDLYLLDGGDLDDLYEERNPEVSVYALGQAGRVQKPIAKPKDAREILKRRAAREEQLP